MAKIHLVSGPVGAGKTTFARRLSGERRALLFSIDEWMTILFTPDLDGGIDYDWAMARIGRIESLIWSQIRQLRTLDVEAILDLGLLQRDHRQKFYDLARAEAFDTSLHFVDAARETRWQRVMARNAEKGDTYNMDVDRGMFDFCEGLLERPSGDELDHAIFYHS
ncbi:MAG: ATP-binding protein [Alphaproteobacteria bacterium]|nr:ATP-binding protein [Alphaproteobacteria bacterium]